MNLLQKAKTIEPSNKKPVNDDVVELSLAWLKGEVTLIQVYKALGFKGQSSAYAIMVRGVRHAYDKGLITVNKK